MQPMGPVGFPGGAPVGKQKMSALAVAAFILSLLFFLPFIPLIGAILGIVSLARGRQDLGGKGLAIAAIPIGLVLVLFLQGMMAAIAIPAFIRYTRKAKAIEATEGLDKIAAGARSFATTDHYDQGGTGLPRGFPRGSTGWVPAIPCCQQPTHPKCMPAEGSWSVEPWRSLHFQMSDPHYFQWRYESDGRTMTAEARGDLDCDGSYSSFKIAGSIEGNEIRISPPIINDELE
jgi:hypothetical protein